MCCDYDIELSSIAMGCTSEQQIVSVRNSSCAIMVVQWRQYHFEVREGGLLERMEGL